MPSASCEKNLYSCSSPSMMYSRSVASLRSDVVNQFYMFSIIWCCMFVIYLGDCCGVY